MTMKRLLLAFMMCTFAFTSAVHATGGVVTGGTAYRIARRASAGLTCSAANESAVYADTTFHSVYFCDGTVWKGIGLATILTVGTATATNRAEARTVTDRYDWTNAMVVALGAGTTGDITMFTLPAKTKVDDFMVVIDTPDTSANALSVACGVTSAAYIDYVVASDAKAAANTVYGDATAERGTNMVIVGGHMPSYTGTTAVLCHFIKTTTFLNSVTGSTGHVLITRRLLQ